MQNTMSNVLCLIVLHLVVSGFIITYNCVFKILEAFFHSIIYVIKTSHLTIAKQKESAFCKYILCLLPRLCKCWRYSYPLERYKKDKINRGLTFHYIRYICNIFNVFDSDLHNLHSYNYWKSSLKRILQKQNSSDKYSTINCNCSGPMWP